MKESPFFLPLISKSCLSEKNLQVTNFHSKHNLITEQKLIYAQGHFVSINKVDNTQFENRKQKANCAREYKKTDTILLPDEALISHFELPN